ncbi:MAG: hypothetical protein WDN29_06935 [Methylovirgula sp.]
MSIKCAGRPDIQCVSLADVTDRVCEALDDVGEIRTPSSASDRAAGLGSGCTQSRALRELQDFDHISQKLKNLADFLGALALILPEDWQVDPTIATKVLTLADLSRI